jgi:uncharacterized coiled-coil protein SlyX
MANRINQQLVAIHTLSELEKRIAEIEQKVADQQGRIAHLERQGEDTQAARTLLIHLHALLDERVAQRDRLRREIAG